MPSYVYTPSIDNLDIRDKRKKASALTQDLDSYIYDMKTGPSLMFYLMSMLDADKDKQEKIRNRIQVFCETKNHLFKDTHKVNIN